MPGIFVIFLVCLALFLLFPKGFKFMVGTWVGTAAGGFFWGLFAIAFPVLIAPIAFAAFIIAGVFAGLVLAAKG